MLPLAANTARRRDQPIRVDAASDSEYDCLESCGVQQIGIAQYEGDSKSNAPGPGSSGGKRLRVGFGDLPSTATVTRTGSAPADHLADAVVAVDSAAQRGKKLKERATHSRSRVVPELESSSVSRSPQAEYEPISHATGSGDDERANNSNDSYSGGIESSLSPMSSTASHGQLDEPAERDAREAVGQLSGVSGGKKSSVASSSMSKSSGVVFHKAVEQDAKTVESSLVFLRRALYVVWLSIIAASITILVVDSGIVIGATDEELVVRSEGDRASFHTVG